jgi:metal-dependent hydrolase (beta-lactamase superfamily II)
MLVGNANAGIGEWGFAAVLDVDGRRLLIDTGARAETMLKNASELRVDLASISSGSTPSVRLDRTQMRSCAPGHR